MIPSYALWGRARPASTPTIATLPGVEVPAPRGGSLGPAPVGFLTPLSAAPEDLLLGGLERLDVRSPFGLAIPTSAEGIVLGRILLSERRDSSGAPTRELRIYCDRELTRVLELRMLALGGERSALRLRVVQRSPGQMDEETGTEAWVPDVHRVLLWLRGAEVQLVPEGPLGLWGVLRLRFPRPEKPMRDALRDAARKLGLAQLLLSARPGATSGQLLSWELFRGDVAQMSDLALERRSSAIVVPTSAELGRAMRLEGARYPYVALNSAEALVEALSLGLQSTAERWLDGVLRPGSSMSLARSEEELSTLATRIVLGSHVGAPFVGGPFRAVLTPRLFDRADSLGRASPIHELEAGPTLARHISPGPEGRFNSYSLAHGISRHSIVAVSVDTDREREALEGALARAGLEAPVILVGRTITELEDWLQ